jgi:hypothetical protein
MGSCGREKPRVNKDALRIFVHDVHGVRPVELIGLSPIRTFKRFPFHMLDEEAMTEAIHFID